MKMNLKQLAAECADQMDLSHKAAESHLRTLFDVLAENMAAGHEVTVPGFGKFRRKDRPARTGRNPKTGESMEIAAKSVPNFLAAKQLKEACNG